MLPVDEAAGVVVGLAGDLGAARIAVDLHLADDLGVAENVVDLIGDLGVVGITSDLADRIRDGIGSLTLNQSPFLLLLFLVPIGLLLGCLRPSISTKVKVDLERSQLVDMKSNFLGGHRELENAIIQLLHCKLRGVTSKRHLEQMCNDILR